MLFVRNYEDRLLQKFFVIYIFIRYARKGEKSPFLYSSWRLLISYAISYILLVIS